MALYMIPVTIAATAYVEATDEVEAMRIARERQGQELSATDNGSDFRVTTNGDGWAFSLAPDMTMTGPHDDARASLVGTEA